MVMTDDRMSSIRQAEARSHMEAYQNLELYAPGSWLSKPVRTVMGILPCFDGYQKLRVLDLGSGIGRNAIAIAKYFPEIECRIDCVDILEMAIEKLTENAEKYEISDSITGIVSSIDEYAVPEETYDFILAVSALEHIGSKSLLLKKLSEIRNGLCANGVACLIMNSSVMESAKATGESLIPQFEVNLPTDVLLDILKETFSEWKILKQTVVHQTYEIPRDMGISLVDTDVVTYVVQKP